MSIGKIVCELAPNDMNRRNSEGDFIELGDGRIAYAYTRYRDGMEDGCQADIAVIFSSDGGESFSREKIIISPEDCDAINIMSVSLFKLESGEIAVFYLKKSKGLNCIPYMRKTRDFESFSEEIRCIDSDGYFAVNNDRVRRLSDGRLIFPAAYMKITKLVSYEVDHHNMKNENGELVIRLEPAIAMFYESRDDGNSWQKIGDVAMPYKIFTTGLQEPGLVELSDGTLYAYFRNNSGRQFESYSYDGGKSWTLPEPSQFTSPESPMCTQRLADGRIAVVYNPAPLYFGRGQYSKDGIWTGGRNPLVICFADGNMRGVTEPLVIEDDESRGFAYTAIFETKSSILLAYCAGGAEDKMMLNRVRIRKIDK